MPRTFAEWNQDVTLASSERARAEERHMIMLSAAPKWVCNLHNTCRADIEYDYEGPYLAIPHLKPECIPQLIRWIQEVFQR